MTIQRLAAVTAVAALAMVSLAGRSAAAGASAWAPTHTQAISLAGATDLGPVSGSTPLHISVALALRNQAGLQSYIKAITTPGSGKYGRSLTPAQFGNRYGPASSQVSWVEQYLIQNGFSNLSVTGNHLFVSANGTAAEAESAFNTAIDSFKQNGVTVYANVEPAMVPAFEQQFIIAVLGLDNALKMQLPLGPSTSTPDNPTSYWAPGFQEAYGAKGTAGGSKTPIAIFAEGALSQVVKDLHQYRSDSKDNGKLSQVPVSIVHTGVPSSDTSGLVEWDMDTQTSTGLAGSVKRLYLYDATSLTDSDVTLEFAKFASQDKAKAGSASFGECEYAPYLDGMMLANDQNFAEAAAQGQTVFASAGDSGGFCAVNGAANGAPVGEPDVNYPASSPYVVAAGGTTLYTSGGKWDMETAWDSGGGGISLFEAQPYWQSGVAPPTGASCQVQAPACLGRDLPDVGMDADFLLSAANFYNDGTATSNGGTSLSSPLSLGSWARIESDHHNKIGFAAPRLYAAAGSTGYNTITPSDCGPYPATPGWNYCTGNGSFNIGQMDKKIAAAPAKITFPPVPAPACNLFYGTGTASPAVSSGNDDALAIESGGMSTNASAKTITGVLRVKSLDDGPGGTTEVSGTGDDWFMIFGWKGTTYFLSASYDAGTLPNFSFSYGHITKGATGGDEYVTDGTAVGAANTSQGLLSITAPMADFGGQLSPKVAPPVIKSTLSRVGAQTFEEVGDANPPPAAFAGLPAVPTALLEGAASASGSSYVVGHDCK